jgi:leucyl aminopeptidase
MQIRFADQRPAGDFALVLPVAGKDRSSLDKLGAASATVGSGLDKQRFDGEPGSVAEQFIDDSGPRRLLVVGIGTGGTADRAEKLGGTAAARLQTSGDKIAVIDLSGIGFDADAAARVALGAALRSWRYDRYRTRLKEKQKPTLEEIVICCRRWQWGRAALPRAVGAGGRGGGADP